MALPRQLLGLIEYRSYPLVSIDTYNACVDFPIFDARSRSLKKTVMGLVGGNIASNSKVPIIEALRAPK